MAARLLPPAKHNNGSAHIVEYLLRRASMSWTRQVGTRPSKHQPQCCCSAPEAQIQGLLLIQAQMVPTHKLNCATTHPLCLHTLPSAPQQALNNPLVAHPHPAVNTRAWHTTSRDCPGYAKRRRSIT